MTADPNCVFCRIVAGTLPSFKIYEDDKTLAFLDINPIHDGHALVIPKAHAPTLMASRDEDLAAVMRIARRVATAVETMLKPDGINLLQANGKGAAQSVFHLHLHVVPRLMSANPPLNWDPKPGDKAKLAALAPRLAEAIKAVS
ncbi:MAG: HIT family protein [Alphaproteobacteria bacterium]|nr:HIT family protein [Alphaproteobacteria bacterium]